MMESWYSICSRVALLAEGVDRNFDSGAGTYSYSVVALLAEGVDRNIVPLEQVIYCRVALLAEGVDRNHNPSAAFPAIMESPSSRRAQVEIDTKIW